MKILGISAFYHDSAAALVIDGEIMAAAQEERFTRNKNTEVFPIHAIKYCLEESGLEIDDLDAVVFYDKALLKFERLLETYYSFAPKGLQSFLKSIPVWLDEKVYIKRNIYQQLKKIGKYDKKKLKLLFTEHHLAHAGSCFFASPYQESAILTIDGVGEWCTASIGIGKGNKISILKEMHFPHSLGLLYSAFTYYLGFTVNSGEYKLMGLAPYGNPDAAQTKEFIQKIKTTIVDIKDDGSIWLNQKYFNYATGLKMVDEKKWYLLFGFERRKSEATLKQEHCNLAYAIQKVSEEIVLKMAAETKRITGMENICLAGGVALNCVANGQLYQTALFKNIFIQPAAGDAGGALGAALSAEFMYFDKPRTTDKIHDLMKGSYLGPEYSEKEVLLMLKKNKATYLKYDDFNMLNKFIAAKLDEGSVVGWFQGRMEFGPRALGNRSILGDARNEEMQKKLNIKIKYREGFRPFAPAVLFDDITSYFELDIPSPYMLFTTPVKKELRYKLPDNYQELPLWDRLYYKRSRLQSITHLDFSARIQTVHKETNIKFYELIKTFKELTSYGVIVNTSFNVRGEPIVCTPMDAYKCFMSTDMDFLVINNFVLIKTEQLDWENKDKWKINFKAD